MKSRRVRRGGEGESWMDSLKNGVSGLFKSKQTDDPAITSTAESITPVADNLVNNTPGGGGKRSRSRFRRRRTRRAKRSVR
jgi:hypothetical protein